MKTIHSQRLRGDKRAMSPAVSSVIMTAAVMIMVLVAVSYANSILSSRLAENEFTSNKQFMLTTGLQIDDVAWTVGRTQTIIYASKYGFVKYQPSALNYSVDLHVASGWTNIFSNLTTGLVTYNMPIGMYNLGNGYFERISPRNNGSFLQQGPTAPVSSVFVSERLPMPDGGFLRTIAVPTIRTFNTSIVGPSQSAYTNYYKFFLPTLQSSGNNPSLSQSLTMAGTDVVKVVQKDVNQIRITVNYPSAGIGFNSTFFAFENSIVTQTFPANSIVEFYVGNVIVSVGQV